MRMEMGTGMGMANEAHLGVMGEIEDHLVYLHHEAMTIAIEDGRQWTLDHPAECRLGGRIVMHAALRFLQ